LALLYISEDEQEIAGDEGHPEHDDKERNVIDSKICVVFVDVESGISKQLRHRHS